MEGRVCETFLKIFQNSKDAQNRSQKRPNVFWTCFGCNSFENFFAQCSTEGRVFEMFSKNQKRVPKFQKCPKSFPKKSKQKIRNFAKFHAQNRSQKCPNVFWTCFGVNFSRNFFCPVFHGGSSLRNVFKKFSKFQKRPKSFPNCPNVFWTCFGVIFSKMLFFAQCSMEGRVFEMFSKNLEIFKIPKMPRIVPKSVQTCFEHVLG